MAEKISVDFGANIASLEASMSQVREFLQGLTSPLRAVRDNLGEVAEAFIAAFAVEKMFAFMEGIAEMGAQVKRTASELGTSASEVSSFNFMVEAMSGSAEGAAAALMRLERNMLQAEKGTGPAAAAFKALHISVTDSAGKLKTFDQTLAETADTFQNTPDGPNKTAIAMALMGRAGAQMIPVLNEGRGGIEKFKQMAVETGTVLTDDMVKGMEETKISSYTMGQSFVGVSITLFEMLKPAFDATVNGIADLVESFNNAMKEGGALYYVIVGIEQALIGLVTICAAVSSAIQEIWQVIMGLFETVMISLQTTSRVVADMLTGNFTKAKEDFKAGIDDIASHVESRLKKMVDAGHSWIDVFNKMEGLNKQAEGEKSGSAPAGQLDTESTSAKLQRELKEYVLAHANAYTDMTKVELEYWNGVLKTADLTKDERLNVEYQVFNLKRKLSAQDLSEMQSNLSAQQALFKNDWDKRMSLEEEKVQAIARTYGQDSIQYAAALRSKQSLEYEYDQHMRTLRADRAKFDRDYDLLEYDFEEEELNMAVDNYQMSLREELAARHQLANARYAIMRKELEEEKIAHGDNLEEVRKINQQLEMLDAKHALDSDKITNQGIAKQRQAYLSFFGQLTNGFGGWIQNMANGTAKLSDLWKGLFQNMIQILGSALETMIVNWLTAETVKSEATALGEATRTGLVATGAATQGGITAAAQKQGIIGHAWSTAAAVFDDVAQIPYVGWILAPPAAAAAAAAVLAFGSGIPSFDVGAWNLNSDMVAKVHKGETIIPAGPAAAFRDMMSGKGQVQSPQAGDMHLHIHAIDAKSMLGSLTEIKRDFSKMVRDEWERNPSLRPSGK